MNNTDAPRGQHTVPPSYQVYVCGPFLVKRWDGASYQSVPVGAWSGSHSPRLLLKVLLCSPGRQASRGRLLDLLWPDSDPEEASSFLNDAAYRLRAVLRPTKGAESLLLTAKDTSSYALVGQADLWVDADAALTLLEQAEQQGENAFSLLEEAAGYLSRGEFLAEEELLFFYGRRATVARARRGCLLAQAKGYERQGRMRRAEGLLGKLLEENPLDEDALCSLMLNLHRQARTSEGLRLYEETRTLLAREGLTPTEATRATEQRLRSEQPFARERLSLASTQDQSYIQTAMQGIIGGGSDLGYQAMDMLRRQLLQLGVGATSSLFTGAYTELEQLERLVRALKKPSCVDEIFLTHLEMTTRSNRKRFVLAKNSLPDIHAVHHDASIHLQVITQLLEHPLSTHMYSRLCSLAGETVQLLGDIYFHKGDSDIAALYYDTAIRTASDARNKVLQAVILGRKSFIAIYGDDARKALPFLEQAHELTGHNASDLVRAWLMVVEAEVQAKIGDIEVCKRALDQAEFFLHRANSGYSTCSFTIETIYAPLNEQRLLGYMGACYLHLRRPQEAKPLLQTYLTSMSYASLHKQAITLVDLAKASAFEEELGAMSMYADQALRIVEQTRSARVYQRLFDLRREVDQWQNTPYVKQFNQQLVAISRLLHSEK